MLLDANAALVESPLHVAESVLEFANLFASFAFPLDGAQLDPTPIPYGERFREGLAFYDSCERNDARPPSLML